jgi:DNA-binding transcriptional LysR family regulator
MKETDTSIQKCLAFVTAVDTGGFTKAAEAMSCSQSGISRMIGDLEKEWGVTLLERGRNGIRLTPDGEKLLPQARGICEDYRRLRTQVDELTGLRSGTIRIGTFSSVATHWLPNIIREYRRAYPDIEYEILLGDYDEIENWVADGRVDCGFLREPVGHGLETMPMARDRLMAVIPENHPLAHCERFPIAAFCKEPFMLLEKGGGSEVSELFEQNGLRPNVRFTTWDDYAIMSMVENGLGLGILPELILRRAPYRIVAKELDVPAYRDIVLAMRNRDAASVAVRRFLDYLRFREMNSKGQK